MKLRCMSEPEAAARGRSPVERRPEIPGGGPPERGRRARPDGGVYTPMLGYWKQAVKRELQHLFEAPEPDRR